MYQCRFCGKKVASDAVECEHCGKTIGKSNFEPKDGVRLTNIDSWQNKSIPAWVMYLVVAFFITCIGLMIYKGCDQDANNKTDPEPITGAVNESTENATSKSE